MFIELRSKCSVYTLVASQTNVIINTNSTTTSTIVFVFKYEKKKVTWVSQISEQYSSCFIYFVITKT